MVQENIDTILDYFDGDSMLCAWSIDLSARRAHPVPALSAQRQLQTFDQLVWRRLAEFGLHGVAGEQGWQPL